MSDRTIPWLLATQYRDGSYNGTFDFSVVQPAFDLVARYFRVSMPRVSSGAQVRVIQSNKNKNNWAAWTSGNSIYISPTFNFANDRRRCAKVAVHEFGHIGNGTSHSKNPGALMAFDGGTSQGWMQDDLRWFGRYRLRGAMPPAGIFATTFGVSSVKESQEDDIPHGEANGFWSRFLDLVRPTYAMKEQQS
jgi:hypothetical protein